RQRRQSSRARINRETFHARERSADSRLWKIGILSIWRDRHVKWRTLRRKRRPAYRRGYARAGVDGINVNMGVGCAASAVLDLGRSKQDLPNGGGANLRNRQVKRSSWKRSQYSGGLVDRKSHPPRRRNSLTGIKELPAGIDRHNVGRT